jgi:glycosyltransferase 2 family protein
MALKLPAISVRNEVMRGRATQLMISLIVGGGCLYLAFRNAPLEETWAEIKRVPLIYHAVYLFFVYVQFVLRSKRWAIQAEGISGRAIGLREAVGINAVAFAAVFLLPFRLGEFVRPYLVSQRKIMSVSAGLANSVVERVVDGLLTTGFFAVVLVLLRGRDLPSYVTTAGWMGLALFGGATLFFALAFRWRNLSLGILKRITEKIHPKLAKFAVGVVESFLDGLDCFKSTGALAGYLLLSAAYWLLNGFGVWIMLQGLGADQELLAGYFAVSFMVIAVMIPAPPGNIGNFHFFTKEALVLLGVAQSTALAAAVILHSWQIVALFFWAGGFILIGDVSLARIRDATQQKDETD